MKRIFIYITALFLSLATGGMLYAQTTADTAIEQLEQHAVIKALNGAIEVCNPTDAAIEISIFAITGSQVKQLTLEAGDTVRIDLPAGYYIIKAGAKSKRVAIK